MKKPVLAITMGDPGGVGPEVILKSLKSQKNKIPQVLLIGSTEVFEYASKKTHVTLHDVHFLDVRARAQELYGKSKPPRFTVGKVSRWNACLAYASLEAGAELATCGVVKALVTAPLHKEAMRLVDPRFTGHTEYLAKTAGVKDFAMMFLSDKLCVTLATIHLPLEKVSGAIRVPGLVSKIMLTDHFLKTKLKIKSPRIGVATINPHGSEFGPQEKRVLIPAIRKAKARGVRALGPLPGDEIFYEAYEGRLDAVIAMYHDQGLAPFKMIAFDQGVNLTLGLPYIRTSPDHGTAFDIAYQNKARPQAFLSALKRAFILSQP